LREEIPFELALVDVDGRSELAEKFGSRAPVVEIGPYQLNAPFERKDLEVALRAAITRQEQINSIESLDLSPELSRTWTKSDAFSYWLSRHYMRLFNLFVLIYVGIPFLAPVLMKAGLTRPAVLIYRGYGMVCHQLAYRSFFLFGEQDVYPRQAAGVESLETYAQVSGLGETNSVEDVFAARNFIGNDQVGYKVALCQRDVAIYAAILLFGVLFALTGHRIRPLHWALWILIGLGPIGLDGFSQLLSQPPFNFIQYRESIPALRVLTGALFGFTTAWFGYPMVETTMQDTRAILEAKLARIKKFQEGGRGFSKAAN
jgi:uncharacterized membrane protein